jgi:hypothetical protein
MLFEISRLTMMSPGHNAGTLLIKSKGEKRNVLAVVYSVYGIMCRYGINQCFVSAE